jgi:Zinc finger, C2H2 type
MSQSKSNQKLRSKSIPVLVYYVSSSNSSCSNESSSDDDDAALSSFVDNNEPDDVKSSDSGSNFSNTSEIQKERRKVLKKTVKIVKKDEKQPKEKVVKKDPKPKKAICPICGKTVSRIATHLKVHQDTQVQCDICKKFLAAKASLATHMKLVHLKVRIKCRHCDQLFWNTTTLRVHEQKVHVDSGEQHKCGLCEKIFGHAETLTNHIKYHEYMQRKNGGKQIYFKSSMQCNACDFIYYARPQFEAHINLHNNRFECKFCQEVFTQNYSVGVHRRYSHRNTFKDVVRMYFCDMCEFSTKSGFNLKRHRTWHQKKQ